MPPRLAAPFLVVFAACSLCDAHADAARLELRAVVQAHASIAAVSAPQQVVLGAADVARGYLDLAQELEVQLRTNVPGGVLLAADDAPEAVAPDLDLLDLLAVRFDKFSDGRGYSLARLLRERYGFRGELRAVGDLGRDQLLFLERAGFDAFETRAGADPRAALPAFDELPLAHPAFRWRAAQPPWERPRSPGQGGGRAPAPRGGSPRSARAGAEGGDPRGHRRRQPTPPRPAPAARCARRARNDRCGGGVAPEISR